jgi:ribonucleoside-diphosphate reductase alpha subunit
MNDYNNSNKDGEMQVRKRDGTLQDMAFDKIASRVKILGAQAKITLNYSALVLKIMDQIYDGIETSKIDELMAQQCATMNQQNPALGILAGYVSISNHQKNTNNSTILSVVKTLGYDYLSNEYIQFVEEHYEALEAMIHYERDFLIDYFGFKTLEKSYLMKKNGVIVERPQHMWMRVAIALHSSTNVNISLTKIRETYDGLSQKLFIHATPTLFNAGTRHPQLSSCYLIAMEDDSIDGIYNTLKDCAIISKWAGGIGLHVHNVRALGSHIYGTNGQSTGIVPMLRVFNATARYCNQGGKRNGSFAIYLEPWHADIEDFLQMKRNQGDEERKARDLFYALWIPDLFMQKVKNDDDWHLFCPNKAPGLANVHGDDFVKLYEQYVNEGRYDRIIKGRDLWLKIMDAQMETSMPYLLYKDTINKKCNQSHLGTIKSSNLCTEITLYSDEKETAVCNLSSIALNKFVKNGIFDYEHLQHIVKIITRNLNQVIDRNFYPTEKTKRSNFLHRPIGIGVQGLADCFLEMNLSFESQEARELNKCIFEVIYYAALSESCKIAKERKIGMLNIMMRYNDGLFKFKTKEPHCHEYILFNENDIETKLLLDEFTPILVEVELSLQMSTRCFAGAYSSFYGSPLYYGKLQFDMWPEHTHSLQSPITADNWNTLRKEIKEHGIRNSMLIAPMPTASTSQILGNNECIEPYTSNMYSRRTMAGEFIVINTHMVNELISMGLWSEDIKNHIIENRGSIQYIDGISNEFKEKYKTVWEIPMKSIIDMACDRGAYICQSQSMNLWLEDPNYTTLTSMHFYSWKKGLKTGIYYLRRKPKHHVQQFTIAPKDQNESPQICRRIRRTSDEVNNGHSDCIVCGS